MPKKREVVAEKMRFELTHKGPEELTLGKSGGKFLQAGEQPRAKTPRWEQQTG